MTTLKHKVRWGAKTALFELKSLIGVAFFLVPIGSRVTVVVAPGGDRYSLYRDWLIFGIRIIRYQINTATMGAGK